MNYKPSYHSPISISTLHFPYIVFIHHVCLTISLLSILLIHIIWTDVRSRKPHSNPLQVSQNLPRFLRQHFVNLNIRIVLQPLWQVTWNSINTPYAPAVSPYGAIFGLILVVNIDHYEILLKTVNLESAELMRNSG